MIYVFLFLIINILLLFSPSVALISSIICVFFSRYTYQRYLMYPLILISGSFFLSSRYLFVTHKDDFEAYYGNYLAIVNGAWGFDRFGLEIGLPLFNELLAFFTFYCELSPRLYLFVITLVQLFIYLFFLEKVPRLIKIDRNIIGMLVGFSLMGYPYLAPTLYIRQSFAVLLVLLSFVSMLTFRKLILMASSIFFHKTILLYIPFYYIFKKLKTLSLTLILIFLFFVVTYFLKGFVESLSIYRPWISNNYTFSLVAYIWSFKFLILSMLISCFTKSSLKYFIFFLFFISLILEIFFTGLPFRVFMIYFYVSGLILFLSLIGWQYKQPFKRYSWKISQLAAIFIALSLAKILSIYNNDTEFRALENQEFFSIEPLHYVTPYFDSEYIINRK